MVFFLIYLNVMVETLAACDHCPRTTYLTSEGNQYSDAKYLWAVIAGKEHHPDAKLDAR
jgi:hypothetical protein